jgi:lipoprotein NlpI
MTSQQVEMLYQEAMIFLNQGQSRKSLQLLEAAIKIDKNYLPAWNNKGVVLLELEEYQDALDSFDQVIRLNPGDNLAWYNKGYVQQILEDYKDSVNSLDIFLSREPGEGDFHKYAFYLQAKNYYELKNYEKAIQVLDEALKIDEKFSEAHNLREEVLKNLKK